ncbi:hypothetical protein C8Q80DRAFT_772347 [Daedaleopsis nitida]|nr:hypothetical protein C8Q80DRAFT_772347 [Daedaleopsis nitida]
MLLMLISWRKLQKLMKRRNLPTISLSKWSGRTDPGFLTYYHLLPYSVFPVLLAAIAFVADSRLQPCPAAPRPLLSLCLFLLPFSFTFSLHEVGTRSYTHTDNRPRVGSSYSTRTRTRTDPPHSLTLTLVFFASSFAPRRRRRRRTSHGLSSPVHRGSCRRRHQRPQVAGLGFGTSSCTPTGPSPRRQQTTSTSTAMRSSSMYS